MKRIEFIAPVTAMRGNISGSQVLTYSKYGQRAFDIAGDGRVSPYKYEAKYIGAKRTRNGKTFFSLKTRSTVNLGDNSRLAMAAFGGACSLAKATSRSLTILTHLQFIFQDEQQKGIIDSTMLFRNWLQTKVYPMLKEKENSVIIANDEYTVTINNPWISGGSGTDVAVPAEVKAKFNAYLS